MTTILYIHGFNSAGNSSTSKLLQAAFPSAKVVAPSYSSQSPLDAYAELWHIALDLNSRDTKFVIAGTSLGGFWARLLSEQCGVPALMVNPAVTPSEQLARHVGKQTNFATGEVYDFTETALQQFATLEKLAPKYPNATRIAAVFTGDEVIDVGATCTHLEQQGIKVFTFEGGQHRVSELEIPLIASLLHKLGIPS